MTARELMHCLIDFVDECGADQEVEFYTKNKVFVVTFQVEGGHFAIKEKECMSE